MSSLEDQDWKWLELRPGKGQVRWDSNGKSRVLHIAINMPNYYSLPVRILSLLASHDESTGDRFDSRFVETHNDADPAALVEHVVAWAPDIVAFSVNIWNREASIETAALLRERLPDLTILGGGQEVTHSVYDFLAIAPGFDYLIDGEGELPFLQFLQQWSRSGRLLEHPEEVSGLHYRRDGEQLFTRPAEVVESLDDVPSPILAGLVPSKQKNFLGVMLEGSRGCPLRCSFCFEGAKKPKVRSASIERLAAEIDYMASRGARYFHMMDAILCNGDLERLQKLKQIFGNVLKQNPAAVISVEAYADRMSEEVAACMDVFSIIDIGLQTTNPETAKAIHRPFNPEKFRLGIENLRKADTTFNVYLICGLPFETVTSFLRGVKFVLDVRPTRLYVNELCLLNGTELRFRAEEYGYQFDSKPPYMVSQNSWMDSFQMELTRVIAKAVERQYNLSSRSIYVSARWLPKQARPCGEQITIPLATGCSLQCPGCSNAAVQQPFSLANVTEALHDAADQNVDVLIGDAASESSATLQVSGQLQLAGSARNRLVGPLATFRNQQWVTKMVQRGYWHFKSFVSVQGEAPPEGLAEATRNINNAYYLPGYAHIHPVLEVVLLPEATSPENYRETIFKLAKLGVPIVSVPQEVEALGEAWHEMLTETFIEAIKMRLWIKLPTTMAQRVMQRIDEQHADEIVALLEELDLTSQEAATRPCFRQAAND